MSPRESASVRARAMAAFLDVSLALLPVMLVMSVVLVNVMHVGGPLAQAIGSGFGVGMTALILLGAAQCALVGFTGQSYGKLAMKLRVVRASDDGKPTLVQCAVLRTLVPGLLWIGLPPFALLDVGVGLIRKDGRCLHDLIAGTRVVEA